MHNLVTVIHSRQKVGSRATSMNYFLSPSASFQRFLPASLEEASIENILRKDFTHKSQCLAPNPDPNLGKGHQRVHCCSHHRHPRISSDDFRLPPSSQAKKSFSSNPSVYGRTAKNKFKINHNIALEKHNLATKKVVPVQGERILAALNGVCQKLDILAFLPQIMSRLIEGDKNLELILGPECTDAILHLVFTQMNWIESRSSQTNNTKTNDDFILKSTEEANRRLQKREFGPK